MREPRGANKSREAGKIVCMREQENERKIERDQERTGQREREAVRKREAERKRERKGRKKDREQGREMKKKTETRRIGDSKEKTGWEADERPRGAREAPNDQRHGGNLQRREVNENYEVHKTVTEQQANHKIT